MPTRSPRLAFSPDGKRLATVGLDRQIVLWDPLTPSDDTAIVFSGHTNNLRHVQFLPDGKHLVSVGESGEVFFWDVLAAQVAQDFALDLSLGVQHGHIARRPPLRRRIFERQDRHFQPEYELGDRFFGHSIARRPTIRSLSRES